MLQIEDTKILVIDDDEFILSLTTGVLQKLGFENVDTVSSGQQALDKMDGSSAYSVIICDLNMPEMDGIEFMRHAQEREFSGGVILLSGEDKRILDLALEMTDSQKLNILGSLTKPVQLAALRGILGDNTILSDDGVSPDTKQEISAIELAEGLEQESSRLLLHFQPIIHMRTGDIVGVESIPRWNHPERGVLDANTFIPVAEEQRRSSELTLKIYEKAVEQTASWLSDGIFLQNFIGISFETLTDNNCTDLLLNKPRDLGINLRHINLKLRDDDINGERLSETLMKFHFKKIGIAIDNFDFEQTAIDEIDKFPFSQIGSGKELLLSTRNNPEIIPTIKRNNTLAKKLNLEVSLNGIQDIEDWNQAESLGFDCVQGEFCSVALPNSQLLEFLESWSPPPPRF